MLSGHFWTTTPRIKKNKDRNYLIWKGHIKRHSQIKVTHFGLLGKANATNWIKDFRNKGSDYWDKFKDIAKVNDSQGWSMKSQSEQDQDRASMRKAIDIDFLKCKEKENQCD